MLTGLVNIAVFAVFRSLFGIALHSNAEFKPLRALRQLDVWRYGRQKRQDVARSGKAGGKNGNVSAHVRHLHTATAALAAVRGKPLCAYMRLFRCQRRRVAPR